MIQSEGRYGEIFFGKGLKAPTRYQSAGDDVFPSLTKLGKWDLLRLQEASAKQAKSKRQVLRRSISPHFLVGFSTPQKRGFSGLPYHWGVVWKQKPRPPVRSLSPRGEGVEAKPVALLGSSRELAESSVGC